MLLVSCGLRLATLARWRCHGFVGIVLVVAVAVFACAVIACAVIACAVIACAVIACAVFAHTFLSIALNFSMVVPAHFALAACAFCLTRTLSFACVLAIAVMVGFPLTADALNFAAIAIVGDRKFERRQPAECNRQNYDPTARFEDAHSLLHVQAQCHLGRGGFSWTAAASRRRHGSMRSRRRCCPRVSEAETPSVWS
jgi:hypothetical protein